MAFTKISEIDEVLHLYEVDAPVNRKEPPTRPHKPEANEQTDTKPESKNPVKKDESLEDSVEEPSVGDTIDEEVIEVREVDLEKIHDSYEKHTEAYKQFHKQYMASMTISSATDYYHEEEEGSKWEWGDELITYQERKEYVRSTMMNALMQGNHNPVDPGNKERYEFWKTASKFNWLLSTMLYDTLGQG